MATKGKTRVVAGEEVTTRFMIVDYDNSYSDSIQDDLRDLDEVSQVLSDICEDSDERYPEDRFKVYEYIDRTFDIVKNGIKVTETQ